MAPKNIRNTVVVGISLSEKDIWQVTLLARYTRRGKSAVIMHAIDEECRKDLDFFEVIKSTYDKDRFTRLTKLFKAAPGLLTKAELKFIGE